MWKWLKQTLLSHRTLNGDLAEDCVYAKIDRDKLIDLNREFRKFRPTEVRVSMGVMRLLFDKGRQWDELIRPADLMFDDFDEFLRSKIYYRGVPLRLASDEEQTRVSMPSLIKTDRILVYR
jgi:hypothetical protein